jgi:hypothetical protein
MGADQVPYRSVAHLWAAHNLMWSFDWNETPEAERPSIGMTSVGLLKEFSLSQKTFGGGEKIIPVYQAQGRGTPFKAE